MLTLETCYTPEDVLRFIDELCRDLPAGYAAEMRERWGQSQITFAELATPKVANLCAAFAREQTLRQEIANGSQSENGEVNVRA